MLEYLKERKWKILLFSPLYIVILIFTCYRANYEIIMPGDITPVVEKVSIDTDYEQNGSFNSVFVFALDKTTPLMNEFANLLPGIEVRKMSEYHSLLSLDEMKKSGKIYYDTGMQYSLINAFINTDKYLEYEFDSLLVSYIFKDFLSDDLRIGDKITAINGTEIHSNEDYYLVRNTLGNVVTFTTDRGDITLEKSKKDDIEMFGFIIRPNYNLISSNPSFEISKTSTQGSSAGLLQSLSIYNQLTEFDYTYGLKIAGTGTINEIGDVGPIGGVEQKIIAADRNDVDIFFVAADNYEDAYNMLTQIDSNMELISCETFFDAISYLKEYGESYAR